MTWPAHIDALLGAVAQVGTRELAPHAARWDEQGAVDAEFAARCSHWGLFGVSAAEDRGGAGAGMLGAAALIEELATHSGTVAMALALHEAVGVGLAEAVGDAALLERCLGAAGFVSWVGLGRGIRAERTGGVRLQGSGRMVPGAGDLVVAATGSGGPVVGFVGADRIAQRRPRRGSGLRAVGWGDIELDVDAEYVGDAEVVRHLAARLSVLVGAVACGLGRAAVTQAIAYARVREQFGQPIAQFQAIQWKLANSATERDAAWLLVCKAAGRLDAGRADAVDASARAQLASARAAVAACSEALQIHGGYGYTREFPIERMLRDARACTAIDRGDDELRDALAPGIADRFA